MIQHSGIHSYQHSISECRAMENDIMSDSTLFAYRQESIGIEVERAVILNVGASPDDNGAGICAYNRVVPDAHSLVKSNITDDHRIRSNEDVFRNGRPFALKW
jgi:hypothetical protein